LALQVAKAGFKARKSVLLQFREHAQQPIKIGDYVGVGLRAQMQARTPGA